MSAADFNDYQPRSSPESITPHQLEALAFQWGAQIEFDGDLAYLTHNGRSFVATLDGWVA